MQKEGLVQKLKALMIGRSIKIPIEVVLVATALPAWFPVSQSHDHPAYEHSNFLKPHDPINWMKDIPNSTLMNQLSLPGTHDTLALHGTILAECQSTPLAGQLKAGIRVLDIRCQHTEDKFPIYHGLAFQFTYFNETLDDVAAFLKEHKTETVFMGVAEENLGSFLNKDPGNHKQFGEVFADYIRPHLDIIYDPKRTRDRTLGAMRGKLVFLTSHKQIKPYAIDSSKFDKEDNFDLGKNGHSKHEKMYVHWEKIKTHLIKANKDGGTSNWFGHYLSGTDIWGGIVPYFVASGHTSEATNATRLTTGQREKKSSSSEVLYEDYPRSFCSNDDCTILFEGTNILAHEFIRSAGITYTGIVYADFPGNGLINTIIGLNFK